MPRTQKGKPPPKHGRKGRARGRAQERSRAQRFLIRWGWILPLAAVLVGSSILLLTYAFASIPLPEDVPLKSATKVYDRDGELIGIFSGSERRLIIPTDPFIPGGNKEFVGEAVVAAEDRDFYEHNGVSLRGIARAAWANVTGGAVQQGGSTITQQYVKIAVLQDPARTVTRKVKEAILAIKLERRHSKDEILGFYLNTIYLGRGAYGIEAAADAYFAKPARKLNLAEAAYLASIIPSPEAFQPDEQPDLARQRRDRVLDAMVAEGFITDEEAERAKSKKVKVKNGSGPLRYQNAAYFMEWIRKDILEPQFGDDLYTGGLEIHTTLDLDMQKMAEEAIASTLIEPTDPQASLVSMTPQGEVRAFVGGKAFRDIRQARGFNFASDPPGHQAGSTAKPFTLLTAIEEGISPGSTFSGASPRTIMEPECNPPWEVDNFGGSSFGTLTLDQATQSSVNTVYAQLVAQVGAEKVAETFEEFGFGKDISPNCSLALGSIDVTPLQMTRGYAGFAAMGVLPRVTPVAYVLDGDGRCLKEWVPNKDIRCNEEAKRNAPRVADENAAAVLTQVLTHVVQGGTAPQAALPGWEVAGKTGTAQNNVAAWFSGYTSKLVTTVWMGYPVEVLEQPDAEPCPPASDDIDGGCLYQPRMGFLCEFPEQCRPVRGREVTGGSFPADIWAAHMQGATADQEPVPFPVPTATPTEVI
ncbi:MAG TPA: transglycosylase domain-containing protein, partial [Actinomycetota bacterium]|nr:transglycosylase domain-containing protein [Actinomycetota bacterium]